MRRVALLGAGFMGQTHAKAFEALRHRARVRYVATLYPDAARSMAERLGAELVTDWQTIVSSDEIDTVDITLPTFLHASAIAQAACSGKDIICEKPLTLDPQEGAKAIRACREHGVQLLVAHVVRFFPAYRRAWEAVRGGELGTVKLVRAARLGSMPTWGVGSWYQDTNLSGGPLVDLLIHDFDFAQWVAGPVESVTACTSSSDAGIWGAATVRFSNGALGVLEGSWAEPRGAPFHTQFEIVGTRGRYAYDNLKEQAEASSGPRKEPSHQADPYFLQIQHFLDCLDGRDGPVVTAEDALLALEVAVAANRSALENAPVTVRHSKGE